MPPLSYITIIRIYSFPILGIIFLSESEAKYEQESRTSFRPRIGDYFLSDAEKAMQYIEENMLRFPSPYWGLFFYRIKQINLKLISEHISFRPRTGDYFFIKKEINANHSDIPTCFRPRTGDYFFILRCHPKGKTERRKHVSVPVLGIIFLSLHKFKYL